MAERGGHIENGQSQIRNTNKQKEMAALKYVNREERHKSKTNEILSEGADSQNDKNQDIFSIGSSNKMSPYLYHTQGSTQTKEKMFNFQIQQQQLERDGEHKLLIPNSASTTNAKAYAHQLKSHYKSQNQEFQTQITQISPQYLDVRRQNLDLEELEFKKEDLRSPQISKHAQKNQPNHNSAFQSNLSSLPSVHQTQTHKSSLSSSNGQRINQGSQQQVYQQTSLSPHQNFPSSGLIQPYQNSR